MQIIIYRHSVAAANNMYDIPQLGYLSSVWINYGYFEAQPLGKMYYEFAHYLRVK